jgi:type IV secretion system protein TrbL
MGATILNQLVQDFQSHAAAWQGVLRADAIDLFWLLVAIDFVFMAIRLVFRGADFAEWLGEFVQQILFIGFFYALLTNSVTWATDIVNSLREAANQASAAGGGMVNLHPADVLGIGVNIGQQALQQMSVLRPGAAVGLAIAGVVIICCFALIAAWMILALVESYIVISAGVLFMGFGGSRWTKDIAITIIRYALSVGAKLFVMQLLVGIGESIMQGWFAQTNGTEISISTLCVMIGCAIVMVALVMVLPALVQGLMNGTSVGHGGAMTAAAAMIGGGAAGVALGLAGSGAVLTNSARLAGTQLGARENPPASRIGRLAAMTGSTARNVGSAVLTDVGRRLSGQVHHGQSSWRMASDLGNRNRLAREEATRPPPPAQPQPPNRISGNP